MSITPTAIVRSASARPGSYQVASFVGAWLCSDHMATEHNPATVGTSGSKRLSPGTFAGDLT